MSQIPYKEFKDAIRNALWPSGEARSLRDAHNRLFGRAMTEISKWVICNQKNNTSVYPACATYVECAKTVIESPNGVVRRVYAIANDEWCDKVFYKHATFADVETLSRNLIVDWVSPENKGMPALQQGMRFAEASTDSEWGRARSGIWVNHRHRLYVFPWLQSNESLVVEWDGFNLKWKDEDLIDTDIWDENSEHYVQSYVAGFHEQYYGSDKKREADMKQDAADVLADMIYQCKRKIEGEEEDMDPGDISRISSKSEIEDDVLPTTSKYVIGFIGDSGMDNQPATDVANLVKTWAPDQVVLLGDNIYPESSSYDVAIGKRWFDYIYGYAGAYGNGPSENKLWPIIGNHDRDPVANLAAYYEFFPAIQREPYYEMLFDDLVHILFVDSGYDGSQVNQEADGVTVTSRQAEWVRVKLLMSQARWKVVCFHHPPYSSTPGAGGLGTEGSGLAGDGTLSYPVLRWPLKSWGAHVLLNGHAHNYERLLWTDGLTQLINGIGGRELKAFGAPLAISQVRYVADYGALKLSADCDSMTFEFFSRTGTLVDTVVFK